MGKKIRVILADDHAVMRQGLVKLVSSQPDIQVVGEASTGREALELARQIDPDLILMDISMPDMDGIEATRIVQREMPHVHVIGLSMHENEEVIKAMGQFGAIVYVSKTAPPAELLKAIYRVVN